MKIPVWQWDPAKYRPQYICGPDLVMRDSAYSELIRHSQHQSTLFTPLAIKTIDIAPDSVYCPVMTRSQKQEFLVFHSARYNYPISNPEIYLDLIKSLESVWYIICLAQLSIQPDKVNNKEYCNQSIINEFRARNQFPPELLALLRG